ncbi:MAG: hypothetical protein KF773_24970 [Deltaproteobacteria bacterium]|nr:hypothetical protein [Deltaproteobacteria bacterium]MCW5806785.1 hypothetical protein [Deltaproteobacteria bacterium]
MSVAARELPFPIPRGAAIALTAAAPVAVGGVMAARAGVLAPLAAAPAIVFGVIAATAPALYIATAVAGDAPPLSAVARAIGVALCAFGIALAGLVLPVTFLSLSSVTDLTTIAACTAALGAAAVIAVMRLARELQLRTIAANALFAVWAIAMLGISARLWWLLGVEVM